MGIPQEAGPSVEADSCQALYSRRAGPFHPLTLSGHTANRPGQPKERGFERNRDFSPTIQQLETTRYGAPDFATAFAVRDATTAHRGRPPELCSEFLELTASRCDTFFPQVLENPAKCALVLFSEQTSRFVNFHRAMPLQSCPRDCNISRLPVNFRPRAPDAPLLTVPNGSGHAITT